MKFKIYYDNLSADKKRELCERMRVTKGYLSQIARGRRNIGIRVAIKLEGATNGELTRAEICPQFFGQV